MKRFEIGLLGIGVSINLIAAFMLFCQERCFLGVDLESWPVVLTMFGVGLIAAVAVAAGAGATGKL